MKLAEALILRADCQKRVAKNYRELDARIQEINWQTELAG